MRSVFQVVASMVFAQATVAYGADMKSTVTNLKKDATATATDVKTDLKNAQKKVEGAAQDAQKKAEASPAPAASAAPAVTPEDAKKAASDAKKEGAEVSKSSGSTLIIPESAVLPESVLRFRAVYGGGTSEKGYDGAANKVENGLKVSVNRAVAVLEYGITEKISGQLLIPYSLGGKVSVEDKTNFTNQVARPTIEAKAGATITAGVNTFKQAIPLLATGAAGPAAQAFALGYNAGATTPAEIDMSQFNAAFAGVKIPAGANIKDFVDNKFRTALLEAAVAANYDEAKKTAEATKFQEGLGDIEIGAKYAISSVKEPVFEGIPFYASAGVGVRLNTGNYVGAIKDGKRAVVSRGTTDLGIRLNADYTLVDGIQLQVENQSELLLAKGKTYASSKEVSYERDGMREVGYGKLVIAPGAWISGAEFLMLNARYNWDNEAETKTDGKSNGSAAVSRSAQFGVGIDGLKLNLPVQLDYDYVLAARGRTVSSAFDANIVTLKLFYKF